MKELLKTLWKKIEARLRVCLCVFFGGLLTLLLMQFIEPILPNFSIFLGLLGGLAVGAGIVSLLIYWINWA